jgi:hypothetical protein
VSSAARLQDRPAAAGGEDFPRPSWWQEWWDEHQLRHHTTAPASEVEGERAQRAAIAAAMVDRKLTRQDATALSTRIAFDKPTRQTHGRRLLELLRDQADRRDELAAMPRTERREPESGWISSRHARELYQGWLEMPEGSHLRKRAEELIARAEAREQGRPVPEWTARPKREKHTRPRGHASAEPSPAPAVSEE